MKKVFITGITGLVGRGLAKRFSDSGMRVVGSSAHGISNKKLDKFVEQVYRIRLGEEFDISCFKAVDYIVHCAYDRGKEKYQKNYDGTLMIFNAARTAGVNLQVFISSISAQNKEVSEYATIKYKTEEFFLKQNMVVVRPGLVIGKGGLFLRVKNMLKIFPITPLIDGGRNQVSVVYIEDLAKAIEGLLGPFAPGLYTLISQTMTLREFLAEIKKVYGYKSLNINIPISFAKRVVQIGEFLGIPLPINSNNINGLQGIVKTDKTSDLEQIIGMPTPLGQALGEIYESEHVGEA